MLAGGKETRYRGFPSNGCCANCFPSRLSYCTKGRKASAIQGSCPITIINLPAALAFRKSWVSSLSSRPSKSWGWQLAIIKPDPNNAFPRREQVDHQVDFLLRPTEAFSFINIISINSITAIAVMVLCYYVHFSFAYERLWGHISQLFGKLQFLWFHPCSEKKKIVLAACFHLDSHSEVVFLVLFHHLSKKQATE